MFLHSRRFSIWLVSFLVVLVSYLIYNRTSRMPVTQSGGMSGEIADVCDSQDRIGMVGDVGVGAVKNVHYTILNPVTKEVEGEFGFEKLLHQDGNDWELEKPYYRIYRRGFRCKLKGDRARVTVEGAGNRVTPKEGILTGNVEIRIQPQSKGAFSEGVIYLDDVIFAGDKSLFSTAGRVEYDSRDGRLVGKGMELIYNSDEERLEFLKITKLESLHIKRWSKGAMLSDSRIKPASPDSSGTQEEKDTNNVGQGYKCVLDTNVIIETPQELLMAQLLSINDISAGKESQDESGGKGTEEPNDSFVEGQYLPSQETAGDVAINCDGSIVIVPMDSAIGLPQLPPAPAGAPQAVKKASDFAPKNYVGATLDRDDGPASDSAEATPDRSPKGYAEASKATFYGDRIDYSVATGEAVATGASQITFDVNDIKQDVRGVPAKVMITSQKEARFAPASNEIFFEGDSRCTVTREDVNYIRQYFVMADSLEVDLAQRQGNEAGKSPTIKRFAATGDVVHLAGTKKAVRQDSPQAQERLLGGVEMKCTRIDYDAIDDKFLATGPGLIKMDNSQTDEPQKGLGRFSLRRKCYAFLRNFDSLEFDKASNHLVAYSKEGSMLADFIPIADNDSRDKVAVTASRVEADVIETAGGRTELGSLVAKGAVTYEDKDIQCAGGEFVYDDDGPAVSIRGDGSRPCIFNGAIVDSAWRDPKTGKWKTRLKGPGAIK